MKTQSVTKATLLSMLVMALVTAVTLNSCQKEVVKPKTNPAANSNLNMELLPNNQILTQANNMLFSLIRNTKGNLTPNYHAFDSSGCVTITVDTINKPHTITYDYGSGCVGSDGMIRSGQAIISYDNSDIRVVNNVWSMTLNNFTFNSDISNGTISYTNTGTNSNGNLVIAQTGGYVTYMHGPAAYDTLNINYAYEWISGENSSPLQNLQFQITGGSTINCSNGASASLTITSPLLKNAKTPGCNFIIQGTVHTAGPSKVTDVDYGNPGGCSGQMTVTENGVTSVHNQ